MRPRAGDSSARAVEKLQRIDAPRPTGDGFPRCREIQRRGQAGSASVDLVRLAAFQVPDGMSFFGAQLRLFM